MSVRYECVEVSKALVVYCYEADEHNTILYLYLIIWISSFPLYLLCCLFTGVPTHMQVISHYPSNHFYMKALLFKLFLRLVANLEMLGTFAKDYV